ncbi:MAG: endonuclease/exonuclease/phosphatase family protein [Acidobacteria bacterium]|nr:endonuclease/exonuclease/phosphatase family protein [Acidobacteriota bacterium]
MPRTQLIEALRSFPTVSALRSSKFFKDHSANLNQWLSVPERHQYAGAQPKLRSFLRVVSWNIEKGKEFEGLLAALQEHPVLCWSDVILLNEVDVGMSRSRNRHVARELAQGLGMNYVFAPAHLELTRGVGEDVLVPGENTDSLQGNAILSRYPLSKARLLELPTCFEPFEFEEKRWGRRIALSVDIESPIGTMTFIGTHLEVRNSPACRTRQMQSIIKWLEFTAATRPVLIAGDFNTNTFSRGSAWRTLRAMVTLLCSDPDRIRQRLVTPQAQHEGLFEALRRHGFTIDGYNDEQPTAVVPLKGIEDGQYIPGVVQRWATRRMARYDFRLELRLDWIVARGLRPLGAYEVVDQTTGVGSVTAQTVKGLAFQQRPLSDHDPIVADLLPRNLG